MNSHTSLNKRIELDNALTDLSAAYEHLETHNYFRNKRDFDKELRNCVEMIIFYLDRINNDTIELNNTLSLKDNKKNSEKIAKLQKNIIWTKEHITEQLLCSYIVATKA